MPNRLEYLEARYDGKLGTAEEIAKTRTVLAFYLPCLDDDSRRRLVLALCKSDRTYLTRDIAVILRTRRAATPLRYCPDCAMRDREEYGTDYWHLSHQYPGSCICLSHHRRLVVAKDRTHGTRRYRWILPRQATGDIHSSRPYDLNKLSEFQNLISDYVYSYTSHQSMRSRELAGVFQSRLNDVYSTDQIIPNLSVVSRKLHVWLAPFRQANVIDGLPTSEQQTMRYLERMVVMDRNTPDPLHQLLIISWLFKDWETFHNYSNAYFCQPVTISPHTQEKNDPDFIKIESDLLDLIASGIPVEEISQDKRVPVPRLIKLGEALGLIPNRKSTHPNTPRNAAARCMLWKGNEKHEITAELGLSRRIIDRLLAENKFLSKRWRLKQRNKALSSHRATWTKIADNNPGFDTGDLRLIAPDTYTWLYRHDRDLSLIHI